MRKVLVAALALSPALLHAQANSPAQPDSSQAPVLQSTLLSPGEPAGAAYPSHLRVSTGVVAPKLIHTVDIPYDEDSTWNLKSAIPTVVLEMSVDDAGKPTALKVVKSDDPTMNYNVLNAVSQYRFQPATLNGKPTAIPLTLRIRVVNPAS